MIIILEYIHIFRLYFLVENNEKILEKVFGMKNISEFSRVFHIQIFIIDSKHKNKILFSLKNKVLREKKNINMQ